ncbi:alpha-1,3-arabinosyltransferase XAT3 isoform X1 [Elaeis guineensis]|uniref:Alpha-1,3-arabinosyltransferase XAT3 n=1 Tax=Elaeis guineensis var. tenera TaxID=51953 RepID=A0A6J0PG22_ELAGV|nr:alpha-1,3-arabinosyltransferase XAT3 [Elaeis guineensis]
MGHHTRLLKNLSRREPQKLGLAFLVGCLLVLMTLFAVSKLFVIPLPSLSLWLPNHAVPPDIMAEDKIGLLQPDARNQNVKKKQERMPLCDFSSQRSDVCEMDGDIRIHGNSFSILLLASSNNKTSETHESWRIKPHARKHDKFILSHVAEMSVKSLTAFEQVPACAVNHTIPAIIFSTGGYMGNPFHDFTDVLIPLFITSRQYNGEVQFLISEIVPNWITKYQPILKQLSHYEIIDFNKDDMVRCYPHAIVGLRFHKEMSIDPLKAPNGRTMVDFAQFMRTSFALERQSAIKLGPDQDKKPRLLIISRKWTRSFTNAQEIVQMAEGLSFEVVVAEANSSSSLVDFAQLVNSCDVMMGVHGAGLTNLVFLPTNATVIQVVPLGGLEGIAWADFGVPSLDMKLRYLQYAISEEESTLIEQYPRDHAVFKDPTSIQNQGWLALRSIYLVKQNVKLDVVRFKGVLLQALDFLHQ